MTTVRYKTVASIELPNPLYDLCKAVKHDNRYALAVYIAGTIEQLSVKDAEAILDAINPPPSAAEDPPRAPSLSVGEKSLLSNFLELPRHERYALINSLHSSTRPQFKALLEYLQGV